MTIKHGLLLAVIALAVWPAAAPAGNPTAHAAATCADYPNQKAAQEAADTVDADGDGIYCESLPCRCRARPRPAVAAATAAAGPASRAAPSRAS